MFNRPSKPRKGFKDGEKLDRCTGEPVDYPLDRSHVGVLRHSFLLFSASFYVCSLVYSRIYSSLSFHRHLPTLFFVFTPFLSSLSSRLVFVLVLELLRAHGRIVSGGSVRGRYRDAWPIDNRPQRVLNHASSALSLRGITETIPTGRSPAGARPRLVLSRNTPRKRYTMILNPLITQAGM